MNNKSQEEVFSIIERSVIASCIQGYHCTVFAYGQTGSGKTYTIQGHEESPGLIPRTLKYLHGFYRSLKLSFIEIYNENIMDLSNDFSNEVVLTTRDDNEHGVVVDNLNIVQTDTFTESMIFYRNGISNRKTSFTLMNDQSSRSHSIFTIYLEKDENNILKKSKLCFVDLAGSEKIKDIYNKANESDQLKQEVCGNDVNNSCINITSSSNKFKETTNINKSLLCLGKIVHKLGTNDKWHISYRDSKLTFLLKDSLGGNCKLAIIGNVNLEYPADSILTLQFLKRTKMISNNPTINYELFDRNVKNILNTLETENNELKRQMKRISMSESIEYHLNKSKREIDTAKSDLQSIKISISELSKIFFVKSKLLMDIDRQIDQINLARREEISIQILDTTDRSTIPTKDFINRDKVDLTCENKINNDNKK